MASTGTAVPTVAEDEVMVENDSQLEGHSHAAAGTDSETQTVAAPPEPEPQVAEPFATAPSAKRTRISPPSPHKVEQETAA